MKNLALVISVLFPLFLFGQTDTTRKTNSIKDNAYLHPIDCITPYTLKKGEWIYAQSIQTLPFPMPVFPYFYWQWKNKKDQTEKNIESKYLLLQVNYYKTILSNLKTT